jgi:hypothetical protein
MLFISRVTDMTTVELAAAVPSFQIVAAEVFAFNFSVFKVLHTSWRGYVLTKDAFLLFAFLSVALCNWNGVTGHC